MSVIQVVERGKYRLKLYSNGTVDGVGDNWNGRLGLGSRAHVSVPEIIPNLSDVISIYSNYGGTLFLLRNGTVKAAGENENHSLSGLSKRYFTTPTLIPDLFDIISISMAPSYSLFLKRDGTVEIIGFNNILHSNKQDPVFRSPTQIEGLSNIIAIASGSSHSLFLRTDGIVIGLGSNSTGQLGYSPDSRGEITIFDRKPISNIPPIVSIYVYEFSSFFLDTNGSVYQSGLEFNNNDNTTISKTPTRLQGVSDIVQVSASNNHILFLKRDGTVISRGKVYIPPGKNKHVLSISSSSASSILLHLDGTLTLLS